MAEPPRRPSTVRKGTPRAGGERGLASAAPTKPTGVAMIAAGFGAPASSISSRRKSAVGALPMTDDGAARAAVAPEFDGGGGAGGVEAAGEIGHAGSFSRQTIPFPAGSLPPPIAFTAISQSVRIGAPAARAAATLSATDGW